MGRTAHPKFFKRLCFYAPSENTRLDQDPIPFPIRSQEILSLRLPVERSTARDPSASLLYFFLIGSLNGRVANNLSTRSVFLFVSQYPSRQYTEWFELRLLWPSWPPPRRLLLLPLAVDWTTSALQTLPAVRNTDHAVLEHIVWEAVILDRLSNSTLAHPHPSARASTTHSRTWTWSRPTPNTLEMPQRRIGFPVESQFPTRIMFFGPCLRIVLEHCSQVPRTCGTEMLRPSSRLAEVLVWLLLSFCSLMSRTKSITNSLVLIWSMLSPTTTFRVSQITSMVQTFLSRIPSTTTTPTKSTGPQILLSGSLMDKLDVLSRSLIHGMPLQTNGSTHRHLLVSNFLSGLVDFQRTERERLTGLEDLLTSITTWISRPTGTTTQPSSL